MTLYPYNRRLAQPGPQMVLVLLLAAAMLVGLALSMSAVGRSAVGPGGQPPTPEAAPDIAPLVALSVDVG
jgi:hypothetical protein